MRAWPGDGTGNIAENLAPDGKTPVPLLSQGYMDIDTPDFVLKLVRTSQTVAALQPKGAKGFDFTPNDWLERRTANGYHHLGDLTLRVRKGNAEAWRDYDTASARRPVAALPASGQVLAAADVTGNLPPDSPVKVTRSWSLNDSRHLVLRFEIKNIATQAVDIGGLGIPMVFNNIITGRTLEQAHETCSFADPYIGQDAGYLQVTRLSGQGPALLVAPERGTPFEAYEPLDEPMPRQQTFEGVLAWMVHSQAYAGNEWRNAKPWNPPTFATLQPGESRVYGLEFLVTPQIRDIEKTLAANQRPVAVGIPGYILPADLNGRLFLNYPHTVKGIEVQPAGAIAIQNDKATPGGWHAYTLRGQAWGRARLTVTYENDARQSISYYVTKPARDAVKDLGRFLLTKQWFDSYDLFHRSPSVISYDREADKRITEESRVWIAGLSDEAGSGSWLAAAMKEFGEPDPAEVARYEQFVDNVLWGVLQYKDGPNRYGVRKSVFYYSPQDMPAFHYNPAIDWRTWTSWDKAASEDVGRGYNYPHVVAAYWAMYHLGRNHPGLVRDHEWSWYLNQAYQTTRFAFSRNADGTRRAGWVELGLMEGTIFVRLLEDLKHEGWNPQASGVEALMKERADRWNTEAYPFGSEMPWDSTGQEEVYAWCSYFGYDHKARVSLDSVLGYMPAIPHWGYNGNARRYWDFLYDGKISRIERQIHHYGSALNAIPVLAQYRKQPDDYYLLRIGYAGMMAPLSNIDSGGFASAAFHSFPSTLKWDAYSGDYGSGFLGHALNTATYLIDDPEFGWQAFGGDLESGGDWIKVTPRDSFRMRVYIAPRGLWLTLDAGTFEAVALNVRTGVVRLGLSSATGIAPLARVRIEQPARLPGVGNYRPAANLEVQGGAYTVNLGPGTTWIELVD